MHNVFGMQIGPRDQHEVGPVGVMVNSENVDQFRYSGRYRLLDRDPELAEIRRCELGGTAWLVLERKWRGFGPRTSRLPRRLRARLPSIPESGIARLRHARRLCRYRGFDEPSNGVWIERGQVAPGVQKLHVSDLTQRIHFMPVRSSAMVRRSSSLPRTAIKSCLVSNPTKVLLGKGVSSALVTFSNSRLRGSSSNVHPPGWLPT